MKIQTLRYFKSVARLENISRAAEYHMIPQPALSKLINRLETDLGVDLFDRINNRLHLNQNGRIFLHYIEKVLSNYDDGIAAIKSEQNGPELVRLLVLTNRRVIMACLPKFYEQRPEVTFQINHVSTDSQFDICISTFEPHGENLERVPLMSEELRLGVSTQNPLAQKESVTFADLKESPFISMPSGTSLNQILMAEGILHGFQPNVTIYCDDPFFLREYVAMDLGVALFPLISWKNTVSPSNVALLPIKKQEGTLKRTVFLYYHGDRYLSPAIGELIELIRQIFTEER